jgi:hypothetical protein
VRSPQSSARCPQQAAAFVYGGDDIWPGSCRSFPSSPPKPGRQVRYREGIPPAFGNLPFAALDADRIGAWKAQLLTAGLRPSTVNAYLPHSPLMRKSRAGREARRCSL